MQFLRGIWTSFAVRLLVLHFKRHHLLLLFWLLLFAIVSQAIGKTFGLSYLLLDPEYLGTVNFWSFFITGLTFGIFTMTFHITSYILNSYRFPFMASLHSPFAMYCLNNSLIPMAFIITFCLINLQFQTESQLMHWSIALWRLGGFLLGMFAMVFLIATYFFGTNVNVVRLIRALKRKGKMKRSFNRPKKHLNWEQVQRIARLWHADTYISIRFRIRPVRSVAHYHEELLLAVFRQHHINALLVEVMLLVMLIALGYLMEYPAFILPAGASMFLLFSVLIMVAGAIAYWLRGWQLSAVIAIVTLLAVLGHYDLLSYRNKVYGLDYAQEPVQYNLTVLESLTADSILYADSLMGIQVLENWKKKNALAGIEKPKMVMVTASGGGVRAALWATEVMLTANLATGQRLMRQTMLMAGASGGMMGLAYYREQFRLAQGRIAEKLADSMRSAIAADLLNPVIFSMITNDIFFPLQHFEQDQMRYRKDRAYMFEEQFNRNTDYLLDKPVDYYRHYELQADIPMLVLNPTIIQDARMLFISPLKLSYMCRPTIRKGYEGSPIIDGVDFGRLFSDHGEENLRMTTALRMNATYPYILPNAHLPVNTNLEVMDAGIRDNYGIEATTRFLFTFKDWINKNTSGVVIISINSVNRYWLSQQQKRRGNSFFSRLINPLSSLYMNWTEIQRFQENKALQYAQDWFDEDLHFLEFNYTPGEIEQKASMSLHLTEKEKQNILHAMDSPVNKEVLGILKALL